MNLLEGGKGGGERVGRGRRERGWGGGVRERGWGGDVGERGRGGEGGRDDCYTYSNRYVQ